MTKKNANSSGHAPKLNLDHSFVKTRQPIGSNRNYLMTHFHPFELKVILQRVIGRRGLRLTKDRSFSYAYASNLLLDDAFALFNVHISAV